ncbi:hypothetical protein D0Z03_000431 [Geotrichum reessii]|nr:hypothetical protein D0Z03_000431 [Galactomyces reessii]
MESFLATGMTTYSGSSPAVDMSADPAFSLSNKYSLNPRNVVSSAYWKVPDPKINLTAISCHESEPFVAVSSAARDSNLFIYEIEPPKPNTHSLQPENYFNSTAAAGDYEDNDSDTQFHSDKDVSYYRNSVPHRSPAIYAKKRISSYQNSHKHHKRSVSENATAATAGAFDFTSWPDDKGAEFAATSADQKSSPILTHHQTISLGGIYSLAWVPAQQTRGAFGNVLATGHAAGLLHLVLLPDPYTNNGPAEILARFNHTRHVPVERQTSSRVRTINIAPTSWSCTPDAAVISMFSEHLFVWDPARRGAPILMHRAKRARAFHAAPQRNGIVALATDRGISIMDMRFKRPVALAPPHDNGGFVSHVRWAPLDENKVASVHDDSLIKIWDIRTGSPLVCLEGHYDKINDIEWSSAVGQPEELYSASSDGTVRLWDIKKCTNINDANLGSKYMKGTVLQQPSAPLSATSATAAPKNSHRRTRSEQDAGLDWLPSKSWRLYRQRLARENSLPSYNYFLDNQNPYSPCTTIFSNNKEFLGLATVKMPTGTDARVGASTRPHLVSIDNDGFFGVHTKVSCKPSLVDDEVLFSDSAFMGSESTIDPAFRETNPVNALTQDKLSAFCNPIINPANGPGKDTSVGSLASLSEGGIDDDDDDADLDHRLDAGSNASSTSTPSSPSLKPGSARNSSEFLSTST